MAKKTIEETLAFWLKSSPDERARLERELPWLKDYDFDAAVERARLRAAKKLPPLSY